MRISKLKPPVEEKRRGGAPIVGPRSQSTDRRTTRAIYGSTEWRNPANGMVGTTINLTSREHDELNEVCEMYDCVRHAFVKDAVMSAVRWARQQKRRRGTG